MNKQQRSELIPCPGCQGAKLNSKALCHNCKQAYVAEAADVVLTGKQVPVYEEWIEKRVRVRVPALQAELKTAQENLTTVQTKADEKLERLLSERVAGQNLAPEILEAAKAKLKEKEGDNIWRGLGGPGIYREVKITKARLQEAWRLLKDLEAQRSHSVDALLDCVEEILNQK